MSDVFTETSDRLSFLPVVDTVCFAVYTIPDNNNLGRGGSGRVFDRSLLFELCLELCLAQGPL